MRRGKNGRQRVTPPPPSRLSLWRPFLLFYLPVFSHHLLRQRRVLRDKTLSLPLCCLSAMRTSTQPVACATVRHVYPPPALARPQARNPAGEWVKLYKGKALINEYEEHKSKGIYWKWAPDTRCSR